MIGSMYTSMVPGRGAVALLRELARQEGPSDAFWRLFWRSVDGLSRADIDTVLAAVGKIHLERRLETRIN